jgi:hypothetical protein
LERTTYEISALQGALVEDDSQYCL